MRFDILGDLLMAMVRYRNSGFNGSIVVRDETNLSDLQAQEMFIRHSDRYFMRTDSLPADISIKSMAVDKDGLYLETAYLDYRRVQEIISDEMIPIWFVPSQREFQDVHENKILVRVSKPQQPTKQLSVRCLITISLKDVSIQQCHTSIKMLDLLYTRGGFILEDDKFTDTVPQGMSLNLRLGWQQKLSLEQRPFLSLRVSPRAQTTIESHFQTQTFIALQQSILRMTADQLIEFVATQTEQQGEERTRNILLFTIAGNVKRERPGLSWKAARKVARSITTRVTV